MSSEMDLVGTGAPADEEERAEREAGFSRRALIRAGWSVPVIMAVTPSVAFAASGGGGPHTDIAAHVDGGNVTGHVDAP
jgi:uncharacterized protein (DUF1501 family)